jgi:homoserine kinase type II
MAVYTVLSREDISNILNQSGLGNYNRHEGITSGVENTNYFVWSDDNQYILTVFEKRTDIKSLPFVFSFQDFLNKNNIRCPKVLFGGEIYKKHYAIFSFLNGGAIDSPTKNNCFQAGIYMAKMHQTSYRFEGQRENPMGTNEWVNLLGKTKKYLLNQNIDKIKQIIDFKINNDVIKGCIHADYFPDNVFFDDDEANVSGVIDFYFCCVDYYIYDLAIAMNAWTCAQSFKDGYESIRKLSSEEEKFLLIMRQKAAVRIFLTRLYDWHNTPNEAQIIKKDPQEYWNLIEELSK